MDSTISVARSASSSPRKVGHALMTLVARLRAAFGRLTRPAGAHSLPPVSPSRASSAVAPSATDADGLARAMAVVAEAVPRSDDHWRRQFVGAVLAMGEGSTFSDFERRIRAAYRAGDHAAIARRAVARLGALRVQKTRARHTDAIGAAADYLRERLPDLDERAATTIAFGAIARFLRVDSESEYPLRPVGRSFDARPAAGGLQ